MTAPYRLPPLYLAHVDFVNFETGITNGKTAILRDTRGEQRKEEEDDVELVEGCQLHTIFLPSTLVLLVGKEDLQDWTEHHHGLDGQQ